MEQKFSDAKSKIKEIIELGSPFSKENSNSLDELASRFGELERQYGSLMKLNEEYIKVDPFRMETTFDPETGIITTTTSGGLTTSVKLNRADPLVPIKMESPSSISAFIPKRHLADKGDTSLESLRGRISSELESFYFNANKAWDLVEETLLGKNNSKFIGIKMVRNKLIEHSEKGDIFSFGVSKESGPRVKPLQLGSKTEKWNDAGLIKNTEELLQNVSEGLDKL